MKRLSVLTPALLFAAASAFAGVTYDFLMVSTGAQEMTISGSVQADGPNFRMSIERGDGMVFKDGSILTSHDGGKTVAVFNPPTKTYFEIAMEDLTRGAADALNNNPLVKVTFDAPKVSTHDFGDGGAIEGLPTRKMSLDATVNINVDAMGQKLTSSMTLHSENWSTDKVDPAARNLFQMSSPRTGIEALDKVMDAQAASFLGRFPLKQVSTVRLTENGREMVTNTTATVTNLKQKAMDASAFADPAGYKKADSRLDEMTKRAQPR